MKRLLEQFRKKLKTDELMICGLFIKTSDSVFLEAILIRTVFS
jgi:hypothetical protein